jgi:hypothetical protein
LLPPEYKDNVLPGYIPVQLATYNGYGLIRVIPNASSEADQARAAALVKQLRLYPLSKAAKPPEQRFIDMADRPFNAIVQFDETFYESLARMVNEEPVQPSDRAMMGTLQAIGIEKGKEFKPDPSAREVLEAALDEARTGLVESVSTIEPSWSDSRWGFPRAVVDSTAASELDARAVMYFMIIAPSAKPGQAAYLMAVQDAKGEFLRGENAYRLHVPAHPPARQFWAVTVYDRQTCGLIRESPRIGLDSYGKLQWNADGSVDIDFGPKPAVGRESNWIYTPADTDWFAVFRLFGPEAPYFDHVWKLPDIERVR